MKLTRTEIIKRLKRCRPQYLEELLVDCRLPITVLNWGAYRIVVQVIGTPYVIKLPLKSEKGYKCIEHCRVEINAYNKIMRAHDLRYLRKYLPTIHYSNRNTGLILMDYCKPANATWGRTHAGFIQEVRWYVEDTLDYPDSDLKRQNWGHDARGKPKILDLGCFCSDGRFF